MFVDACAIVAIMVNERDRAAYEASLVEAIDPFTSPMAAWEAIIVLAHPSRFGMTFGQTHRIVLEWLSNHKIAVRDADRPEQVLAYAVAVADAHGLGKRALSNFDCFHYAHAKAAGAPLLTLDRLLRETDVQTVPLDA